MGGDCLDACLKFVSTKGRRSDLVKRFVADWNFHGEGVPSPNVLSQGIEPPIAPANFSR